MVKKRNELWVGPPLNVWMGMGYIPLEVVPTIELDLTGVR